ncbi:hypothetical protein TVAG_040350 [Trichomonas vaginalis G3]|uniref:UBX domain-containing protein n=1 Tax=Trichomonas vaginalis (strain ATCC PRA-98 / G3) TaxID=412133 RepID=A2F1T0_TRIV3|nr:thioredoxin-like family [Trichomonas vaginalis G3]EAY01130.1 hypothetical protein TVAG_040350 [Trichomonas vaginalis G3]KAI5540531.1 thioredoxin-like family [Trichomonas vaginalis G3]|eukprot:XP_001313982.1 hypothetical protein [Trichomonas vaginalis G3]
MNSDRFDKLVQEEKRKLVVGCFIWNKDKDSNFVKSYLQLEKKSEFSNCVFALIPIDTSPDCIKKYIVFLSPTVIIYLKGEEKDRHFGADFDKLLKLLNKNQPSDFQGKAHTIEVEGNDEDYLQKMVLQAQKNATMVKAASTPVRPATVVEEKKEIPAPVPVKRKIPKLDPKRRSDVRGDIIFLEMLQSEEMIDKLLDYLEKIGKIDLNIDEIQLICNEINSGAFEIPDNVEEKDEKQQESQNQESNISKPELPAKKKLNGIQRQIVEFLSTFEVAEDVSFRITKDYREYDESKILESLNFYQECESKIAEKNKELLECFYLLSDYIPISDSFNYINDGKLANLQAVKDYIISCSSENSNLPQIPGNIKSSFNQRSPEEIEREKWEAEQALREAEQKRRERDEQLRRYAEIKAKIQNQRKTTNSISQPTTYTPTVAPKPAPKPSGNGSKCKVALHLDGKAFTYLMWTNDTVQALFEKLKNDYPDSAGKEIVIMHAANGNVVEYQISDTLGQLGVSGLTKFKIELKEPQPEI